MNHKASHRIAFFAVLLTASAAVAGEANQDSKAEADRAVKMVPTKIVATYAGGELVELRIRGRMAYLVKPTGMVDARRRWLWEFPFWLGVNDGFGNLQH